MKFIDVIRMCLRNLTKRKLRTVLTVSGVLIGTCAIIVMISLGVGMTDAQSKMISEWADLTLIEVYNYGGTVTRSGNMTSITYDEEKKVEPITDEIIQQILEMDHVQAVTPWYSNLYSGWNIAIYSGEYYINCSFIGVYMDKLEDFGYKLKEGRWQQESDPKGTVIFGQQTGWYANNYVTGDWEYPMQYDEDGIPKDPVLNPFNDEFHIIPLTIDTSKWEADFTVIGSLTAPNMLYDQELKVVGVIEGNWKDYNTMQGVFIDINYMKELIKAYNELNPDQQYNEFTGEYEYIRVRADDMDRVADIEQALQDMGYQTYSQGQARENMKQQTQTIQMMLGALAAVSLFVAALNIANTMIMAVIERTKEIGVMKVLGCDLSRIRVLFLGEAAAIGFIGGVFGIGLSYLISFIINNFLAETMMKMMSGDTYFTFEGDIMISQIPLWLAFAALAFATVVGVVSGFYPANRSVKISALSAISHE